MKFRVVDSKFVELPIRTVDTGYGIERYAWISQGAVSGFHTIYGPILDSVFKMARIERVDYKLLAEVAKFSGAFNLEKSTERGTIWEKTAPHPPGQGADSTLISTARLQVVNINILKT